MFQVIVAACVMVILGAGQVYLRVAIQEIKTQHRRVQQEHGELLARITALEHQYAKLSDPERMRSLALDTFQMEEVEAESQTVAIIPRTLTDRYMGALDTNRSEQVGDDEMIGVPGDTRPHKLVQTLLDVNRAFAQPLHPRD